MVNGSEIDYSKFMGLHPYSDSDDFKNNDILNNYPIGEEYIYVKSPNSIPSCLAACKVKIIAHLPINDWWDHPRILVAEVDETGDDNPETCTFFHKHFDENRNKHPCHPLSILPFNFLQDILKD